MRLTFINKHWMVLALAAIATFSCKKGEIGNDQQESFIKFYGSSSYDQAFEVKEVSDGYILVGNATRNNAVGGGSNTDMCIRKINKFGNEVWKYNYGDENLEDEAYRFIIDDDGGYLVAGFSEFLSITQQPDTSIPPDTAIFEAAALMKTNSTGFMEWSEIYPLTTPNIGAPGVSQANARAFTVQKYSNSYLLAGTIAAFPLLQSNPSDIFALRVNRDSRDYVSSDLKKILSIGNDDGSDVVTSSSIVTGSNGLDYFSLFGTELNQQTNRNTQSLITIDLINSFETASAAYQTQSLNPTREGVMSLNVNEELCFLSNATLASGGTAVELEKFELVDDKNTVSISYSLFQASNDSNDELNSTATAFSSTTDGGFIITGYTTEGQDRQVFLIKTDGEGNKLWEKLFGSPTQNEQGENVIEISDGGYLVLGSAGFDDRRIGNTSVMVIKTDLNGELK